MPRIKNCTFSLLKNLSFKNNELDMKVNKKPYLWFFVLLATMSHDNVIAGDPIAIAFKDFTSTTKTSYSKKLPELIVNRLVNTGQFEVVEREKLDSVTKELDLQRDSGYINPETSVPTGELLGAQWLITGSVVNTGRSIKRTAVYNTTFTNISYHLKARLEVVDFKTGKKLFSHIASSGHEEKVPGNIRSHGTGYDLGPSVANKLVSAMLNSPKIKDLIEKGSEEIPIEMVELKITSVPSGADVEIDGEYVGNAGGQFEVKPGVHTISISLPGYETWKKRIRVKKDMVFNARLAERFETRNKLDVNIQN